LELRLFANSSTGKSIKIRKSKRDRSVVIGDVPHLHTPQRLSVLYTLQKRREGDSESEMIFESDRPTSSIKIRNLIRNARDRVIFVDPYFGAPELIEFALWVESLNADVSVLAGGPFLRGRKEDGSSRKRSEWPGLAVNDCLIRLKQSRLPAVPEVFVMRSRNQAIFHDRLLIVDTQAWLSGHSFNGHGMGRISLVIRLRRPEPIIERVLEELTKAEPFIDYWADITQEKTS
jgi:hypothetical protein